LQTSFLPLPALGVFPGSVGAIAFGQFAAPNFETAERFIPAVGTRTGVPAAGQTQIAIFFERDGTVVVDRDRAGVFFEVPIAGPLPEGVNF
jgi:hypothetical protein